MTKEKQIIHIRAYGFARPRAWIVESVTNGLALCVNRERGKPEWQCVHVPTGKPVIPKALRLKALRKDVQEFIDFAAPLYPWNDWKDAEKPPVWAGEAFHRLNEWRQSAEQYTQVGAF